MSPLPPLVFLHLLADRKLKPGAILLEAAADSETALAQLAGEPDFPAFASQFPCFISAATASALPPATVLSLQEAGCRLLAVEAAHRSDEPGKPVLPDEALWLNGNWYLAPPAKPAISQGASRALALKLVQLVSADADTHEIEDIFRQDPTLSYHLLRLVNSLGMSTGKRVTSFSQAILILGRQQLRRWLNLMLFAARKDDHRAAMLLARVAIRARSLELLARLTGLDRSDQELAFMAGMFSLLGVLFGMPLAEVFKPLQISEALVAAVLRHEGDIGRLLQAVEYAELGDAAGLGGLLGELQLSAAQFNRLSLEACQWMLGLIHEAQGGAHG
jgi:EAL and modified HD-GYP domain-containing signal transduction protein